MNQVWLPLERSQPHLRLWSLNVIALIHSENKKRWSLGGVYLGDAWMSTRPNMDKDDQV